MNLKDYKGEDRVISAEEKVKELEEIKKLRGTTFRAETSIPMLDQVTDGFRQGQLIILSGPTASGKSTLAQTFTASFVENGYKSLWFTYEMGDEEFFDKYKGKLDFAIPRILSSGNLDWVEQRILESVAKYKTNIVFIDNLDFLRDPNVLKQVSLNMASYIGGIVQRLKTIAIENNLIIFLLAHIKKNNWSSNKIPEMEDLRDSGQIPQLADFVLMILRKRSDSDSDDEIYTNKAVLGVIKNRFNGKTKKINLVFSNDIFREEMLGDALPEKKEEDDWI